MGPAGVYQRKGECSDAWVSLKCARNECSEDMGIHIGFSDTDGHSDGFAAFLEKINFATDEPGAAIFFSISGRMEQRVSF